MNCQRCGKENLPDVSYCQGCGNVMPINQSISPQNPGYPQQQVYQQSNNGQPPMPGYLPFQGYGPTNYAGIGSRFLAALIDGIIIGIPIGILSTVLSAMMAVRVVSRASGRNYNPGMAATDVGTFFAGFGFIMILSFVISWAYFAIMESSSWQATVGKRIMGIQVADLNGNRISMGKATIRLAVKAFLSGWFLIGYIMALFTQRKQALHDLIAGTLVLTKDAYPVKNPPFYQPPFYQPPFYQPPQYPQQPNYPPQPQYYDPQTPPVSVCSQCGASLKSGARFCSNCGKNT